MTTITAPVAYATNTIDRLPQARTQQRIQVMRLCRIQLFTTILLSRLAISFGDKQIQMTWIVGAACFLAIGLKTGWAVSAQRLAALVCFALVVAFESLYFHRAYSTFSLIYLFGIYGPLCLSVPMMDAEDLREIWKSMIQIAVLLAVLGLFQVAIEIASRSYFFDPLSLLPLQFQLSGYETLYHTSIAGLGYTKPNGVFALEPSFFSQFIALGLVGELHYFRRTKVIILLLTALLTSFAGTGLLMLFLAIPFVSRSPKAIILMLGAGLVWTVAVGGEAGNFYSQRLSEVNTPGQSGNARFVLPYQMMWDRWQHSSKELLVGIGAGQSAMQNSIFEANFAPVAKVGVEFGLIGLIVFSFFWMGMFCKPAIPGGIIVALLAFYFIASGALLHPPTVFPAWTLTLGFVSAKRAASKT